ncbi:hypothetical protein SDC9_192822 [bioreactor metagenome]|uniref:Uncharacterized protein n=1 Tax=bioreactor metagenome TaxID=1076179 RepID=A0A645I1V5_9ZZZZ
MVLQFVDVQANADGQALHHLDPVAGGVLRRNCGKGGTGAGREAFDHAVVSHRAAVNIGRDRGDLSDADIFQLSFLEIRIDVHFLDRHHRKQRRACLDTLSQLHLALGDDAVDR